LRDVQSKKVGKVEDMVSYGPRLPITHVFGVAHTTRQSFQRHVVHITDLAVETITRIIGMTAVTAMTFLPPALASQDVPSCAPVCVCVCV
jgi:hypothetical protein